MATYNKFQQFVEDVLKGVHDFTSDSTCSVTVALCAAASAPVATNAVLADLTEVSYTNLSSRIVTGVTCDHTTGTASLTGVDLVLTASGAVATFRYVVLYNDDPTTPANPLICWFDYGSDVTMATSETFTIDFASGVIAILT